MISFEKAEVSATARHNERFSKSGILNYNTEGSDMEYLGLYILAAVYTKNDTRNFCLFVYLRSYNGKSKCFYKQCSQAARPLAKKKNTLVSENVADEKNIHPRSRKFIF